MSNETVRQRMANKNKKAGGVQWAKSEGPSFNDLNIKIDMNLKIEVCGGLKIEGGLNVEKTSNVGSSSGFESTIDNNSSKRSTNSDKEEELIVPDISKFQNLGTSKVKFGKEVEKTGS